MQFSEASPYAATHAFLHGTRHLLVIHSTYNPASNIPPVNASPSCVAERLHFTSQGSEGAQDVAHCSNNNLQSAPRLLSSHTLNFCAQMLSQVLGSGFIEGIEVVGNIFLVITSGCGWHLSKHILSHSSRVPCFASMHSLVHAPAHCPQVVPYTSLETEYSFPGLAYIPGEDINSDCAATEIAANNTVMRRNIFFIRNTS